MCFERRVIEEHERKHMKALLSLLNTAKPDKNKTYDSLGQCEIALSNLRGSLFVNFKDLRYLEAAHNTGQWNGVLKRWVGCYDGALKEGWCGDSPRGDCQNGNVYR